MSFYKTNYDIYIAGQKEFGRLVDSVLEQCDKGGIVVRLVFFGKPENNRIYREQLAVIREKVKATFADKMPVVSYVVQRPLVGELVLEMHAVELPFNGTVAYKIEGSTNYIEIEEDGQRELIIGCLLGKATGTTIAGQSGHIFRKIGRILEKGRYEISQIVRQWNYIERITHCRGEHQHYQDFNDARSHFYALADWKDGYPAATGIGTQCGGVLIDLNVIKPKDGIFYSVPLDNELQVAAHVYSQEVLIGAEDKLFCQKTTPKFERAKAVVGKENGVVYISGTAAIRGEASLEGVGVLVQTGITMENINFLISEKNLNKVGISSRGGCKLQMLRVYLKNPDDVTAVKVYMESLFTGIPVSYLLADVCRDELLVEIEGIATFEL